MAKITEELNSQSVRLVQSVQCRPVFFEAQGVTASDLTPETAASNLRVSYANSIIISQVSEGDV